MKVADAVPGQHSVLKLNLLDYLVDEEEESENRYEEQDAQTHTNTKVYPIPISHCGNGVACWGLSTGLQMMVCLLRRQNIPFSPCHLPVLKPLLDKGYWPRTSATPLSLSWPELGSGGNSLGVAMAGEQGGKLVMQRERRTKRRKSYGWMTVTVLSN